MVTLKNEFLLLLRFIKTPDDTQIHIPVKNKLSLIFNMLIMEALFTLAFVIPVQYILHRIIKLRQTEAFRSLTVVDAVAAFVILAPLMEEFLFRYLLRYNRLFSKIICREIWNRIFPFLVYLSSCIFGYIHLSNYANDSWIFYLVSPFIIVSQLAGGLILTYIRVRLSIFYSLLHHALWNSLFGLAVPFVMMLSGKPYMEKNSHYDLTIEEKAFISRNEPVSFDISMIGDTLYRIDVRQFSLQDLLDQIYGKGNLIADDTLINIRFYSKSGISKEEFRKILEKEYDIE